MPKLTLQIHDLAQGWLDAGEVEFLAHDEVSIEYELDYACRYLERQDASAFSVTFPVQVVPYKGGIPGYLIDLIPQGRALRKLLNRYGIKRDDDYSTILGNVPLASPGNLRIKEPWLPIEKERHHYDHPGFTKQEIAQAKENFVDYMEQHGAPIGGTSGAAGGAPKFLLREDANGRFHADGYLHDAKTKQAYLVKFPFTDSENSRMLARVEKAYYDLLREFPVKAGGEIEIFDDVLFIPRFDRIRKDEGRLAYYGLESFYSAHGINTHGAPLYHEENLQLIKRFSTEWQDDVAEYLVRDLLNQILCNTDNHGRNTSFIKMGDRITLSPIYDVTAMKFFKADFIVPLTKWQRSSSLTDRLKSVSDHLGISRQFLGERLRTLRDDYLVDLDDRLHQYGVDEEVIQGSKADREDVLAQLNKL